MKDHAFVIVGNILFCCARDPIMVLNNADDIHHLRCGLHHSTNFLIGGFLIKCCKSEEIVRALKDVGSITHILFSVCSR